MANDQPFQKITEACETTGLSAYYLRKGCKAGTIPHVKSGGVYYINIPALLNELGAAPQQTGTAKTVVSHNDESAY